MLETKENEKCQEPIRDSVMQMKHRSCTTQCQRWPRERYGAGVAEPLDENPRLPPSLYITSLFCSLNSCESSYCDRKPAFPGKPAEAGSPPQAETVTLLRVFLSHHFSHFLLLILGVTLQMVHACRLLVTSHSAPQFTHRFWQTAKKRCVV